MITQRYEIRESLLESLSAQFAQLNKRANKLGLTAPCFEVVGHEDRIAPDKSFAVRYLTVVVTAEPLVIAGWEFAGTIQHLGIDGVQENLLRTVPGVELPADFRNHSNYCEHCNTVRNRKDTYVVRNVETGAFKQVGSTCLADFTCVEDAHALAAGLELNLRGFDCAAGLAGEEGFGEGAGAQRFGILRVLNQAAGVIGSQGWMSRSKARDNGRIATADHVCTLLQTKDVTQAQREFRAACEPTAAHEAQAQAALDWATNLSADDCINDYLHNVRVVANQEWLEDRMLGIACSILVAHENHLARETEKAGKPESHFVGAEKAKLSLTVTYECSISFDGAYGRTFFHFFTDDAGNVLKWSSATNLELSRGDKVQIAGTVKKHETYKGVAQTCLTRCKIA